MRRRNFIALLGGAAVAWPLAAHAQQPGRLIRIGFLTLNSGPSPAIEGFQHGLRQLGYVEGQNLVLIYRWAAGRKDRLIDLASDLLQLKVDIIASNTTEAIIALRTLDKTIPIVMTSIADPVGVGLVASFARPGGYTTGVTLFSTELAGKLLELLKEVVPRLTRIGVLAERDHPPTATFVSETQAAAQALRLALQIFEVQPEEIGDAFRSIGNDAPMHSSCNKPRRSMSISGKSSISRLSTACRQFNRRGSLSKLADCWPMDRTSLHWANAPPGMSIGFSRVRNRPTFRLSNQRNSS